MITHIPVMALEVLSVLNVGRGGVYVDATLGLGGHAEEILKQIGPEGRLIGIDRDEVALSMARDRLPDKRVTFIKGNFSCLKALLAGAGIDKADGLLFDFGVSMLQFKDMNRGFSFNSDAVLDMRMDRSQILTADKVVNSYPEKEICRVLIEYSEERFAKKIAKAIAEARRRKRIANCSELAGIISEVYKGRSRREKIHPATRTFQALRICVNDELGEIKKGLEEAPDILNTGGRLCAISYHSNEDRIVKNFLREADRDGIFRVLTKKPMIASREEARQNPSSRSAKLRGAEKL